MDLLKIKNMYNQLEIKMGESRWLLYYYGIYLKNKNKLF